MAPKTREKDVGCCHHQLMRVSVVREDSVRPRPGQRSRTSACSFVASDIAVIRFGEERERLVFGIGLFSVEGGPIGEEACRLSTQPADRRRRKGRCEVWSVRPVSVTGGMDKE